MLEDSHMRVFSRTKNHIGPNTANLEQWEYFIIITFVVVVIDIYNIGVTRLHINLCKILFISFESNIFLSDMRSSNNS